VFQSNQYEEYPPLSKKRHHSLMDKIILINNQQPNLVSMSMMMGLGFSVGGLPLSGSFLVHLQDTMKECSLGSTRPYKTPHAHSANHENHYVMERTGYGQLWSFCLLPVQSFWVAQIPHHRHLPTLEAHYRPQFACTQ